MAGHIAQALSDHGDHVVGDVGVDGGVDGADELVLLVDGCSMINGFP